MSGWDSVSSGDVTAGGVRVTKISSEQQEDGIAALTLLEEALQLLDRFGAPGEVGGWVDLAINRLRDVLPPGLPERPFRPEEPIE